MPSEKEHMLFPVGVWSSGAFVMCAFTTGNACLNLNIYDTANERLIELVIPRVN